MPFGVKGNTMDRCLIVFDLDTKRLEEAYHNDSWRNAYADVSRVLTRHGFNNIQGTVYLSNPGIRQAHGTIALQEVAVRFEWFGQSVKNVQFYDLADDFNAQFIVDGVTQARQVFQRRIDDLRGQLFAIAVKEGGGQLVAAPVPNQSVMDVLSIASPKH